MKAMEEVREISGKLWKEFREKKHSVEDARSHYNYARIMIESARVDIADQKLRLLTARPINDPPAIVRTKPRAIGR